MTPDPSPPIDESRAPEHDEDWGPFDYEWIDNGNGNGTEPAQTPTPPPADSNPDERPPTSWRPIDLAGITLGDPPQPALLTRDDGIALLYPGRVNAINAEPEAGKTWVGLVAALEVIRAGGHALYIDLEDDPHGLLTRMLELGAVDGLTLDQIVAHFTYVQPVEPIGTRSGKITVAGYDFHDLVLAHAWDLVVVDTTGESMAVEGLDPIDNHDIGVWYQRIIRPLSRTGAAVVVLDHVVKSKEDQGRWAIGGQAKLAGVSGATYKLEAVSPLARARTRPVEGMSRLLVKKDKPGGVRGHLDEGTECIAELHLTSYPDGGTTAHLTAPGAGSTSAFEQRILEHLTVYPGAPKKDLRELGSSEGIDRAVKALVATGSIVVEKRGQSYAHTLTERGERRLEVDGSPPVQEEMI